MSSLPVQIRHAAHLPESDQNRLLAVLCLTVFCSVLNGTMFVVAVPDIRRDYMLSATEVSWVITGFISLFAFGALTFGKLADLFPVRRLIMVGLLLFNAGSVLGLLSENYPQLLAGRFIQACGASSIPALAMLIATRFVPVERRGRVLGAIAATVSFAAGAGPLCGGLLGGFGHWRYLFFISFPTLLALPIYLKLLPREQPTHRPFDLLGALLVGLITISTLLFIVHNAWSGLLSAPLFGLLLGLHLRRTAHPFLPWTLMRSKPYRLALATTFLSIGTVFGMMFLVPILLRELHQASTLQIGLTIFPGAFCGSLSGLWAGRLADRVSPLVVVRCGLALLPTGFLLFSLLTDAPIVTLILVLVVCYSGFAFIHASLAKTVSLILPADEAGIGMGFYNLTFFLSGAFGTAIAGRLSEMLPGGVLWLTGPAKSFGSTFLCMVGTVLIACLLAGQIKCDDLITQAQGDTSGTRS
jgi:DHA2 family metal-tetracycline-proton antiporter-like MFS transporter